MDPAVDFSAFTNHIAKLTFLFYSTLTPVPPFTVCQIPFGDLSAGRLNVHVAADNWKVLFVLAFLYDSEVTWVSFEALWLPSG